MAKKDVTDAASADYPNADKITVLSEGKTQMVVSVDGRPVKYMNDGTKANPA
jgi:hypothetical protein